MYPWKWHIILPTIWVCESQGAHNRELANQTGLGYHYLLHCNIDQQNSQRKLKLAIKILKVRPWWVFDFLIFLNVLIFLRMWTSNKACFRSVVVIDWISEVIMLLFSTLYVFLHRKYANIQKISQEIPIYPLLYSTTNIMTKLFSPSRWIYDVWYMCNTYILNHLNISKSFLQPLKTLVYPL